MRPQAGTSGQYPAQRSTNTQAQLPVIKNQERSVVALDAKFSELLSVPKISFDFRSQLLPIGAILVFSSILVLFYHAAISITQQLNNSVKHYTSTLLLT